jgi:hypothetical protein
MGLALLGISVACTVSMGKMLLLATKKCGVSNLQQPLRRLAEQVRRIACMPDSPPTSEGWHLEEVKKTDATDSAQLDCVVGRAMRPVVQSQASAGFGLRRQRQSGSGSFTAVPRPWP